jgi:hypothetical protein
MHGSSWPAGDSGIAKQEPRGRDLQAGLRRCARTATAHRGTVSREFVSAQSARPQLSRHRVCLEVVAPAADLVTRAATLTFDNHHPARESEPQRYRFRLLVVAGWIVRAGRTRDIRLLTCALPSPRTGHRYPLPKRRIAVRDPAAKDFSRIFQARHRTLIARGDPRQPTYLPGETS